MGDSVDNVPGVDKVGPKTAAKWLHEYGSLDALIANAATIKGAVGDNLRKALPWLPTARKLVTIRSDCDLGKELESIEALAVQPQDVETLRELYTRFEFKAWLRELDSAAVAKARSTARPARSPPPRWRGPTSHYETILSYEQLDAWLAKIGSADLTSIDTRHHLARSDGGRAGRDLAIGRAIARLLHPAGASIRGCAQRSCRSKTCLSSCGHGSKARTNARWGIT